MSRQALLPHGHLHALWVCAVKLYGKLRLFYYMGYNLSRQLDGMEVVNTHVYVTVNCGNQSLLGMPEIFRQYWECL